MVLDSSRVRLYLRADVPQLPQTIDFIAFIGGDLHCADFHESTRYTRGVFHQLCPMSMSDAAASKSFMCLICGWIYNEAEGYPEEKIPPGTKWEDVPPNWGCPECGARKDDFEMVEI